MSTKLRGDIAEQAAILHLEVFIGYGREINLVEADKRQRKPVSADYRDAWELILQRAAHEETCV